MSRTITAVAQHPSYIKVLASYSPEDLVEQATQKLLSAGIQLIEFRYQLYRRMGVPAVVMNPCYLVEDDQLDEASNTVADLGLPLTSPLSTNANTEGKFVTLSRLHRITASTTPGIQQFLQLLPVSFTGLVPCDLIPSPSLSKASIRIPRESAVYACLIRIIARSSRHDPTRVQAQSDLGMLAMHHMYGMEGYSEEDDDLAPDEDPAVQGALERKKKLREKQAPIPLFPFCRSGIFQAPPTNLHGLRMLKGGQTVGKRCPSLLRRLCTSPRNSFQALKPKPLRPVSTKRHEAREENVAQWEGQARATAVQRIKRNALGVQLLSRKLHEQVFKNVQFPPPPESYVNIAKEHITSHGLDPTQGSVLPDVGFDLPALQGPSLLHHFHNIGSDMAQPWLSLAKDFADATLPPLPEQWDIQAGWTKYHYLPDGSSYSEHVEYPAHETMLAFDVETLPNEHPYAIMACAASPNAWYAWISPWLLGQTDDPRQLVPMGDRDLARVVVGHNVSYDRARILEEYDLAPTETRFLDTMALHVAVKGISSNQRPAWVKHKKSKETEQTQKEEAQETLMEMLAKFDDELQAPRDTKRESELQQLRAEISESLWASVEADGETDSKRWEDITSANSLADVAKLHCGIQMDKEIRNDFMKLDRAAILAGLTDYLTYCATDVHVTHSVFGRVLPAFLQSCPHPVSFAGILTMGSSFLCVNEEWEKYIERAETVYQSMAESVKAKLKLLAEEAKKLMRPEGGGDWVSDPWLSQLDWTPKVPKKSRGVTPVPVEEVVAKPTPAPRAPRTSSAKKSSSEEPCFITVPTWYAKLRKSPLLSGPIKTKMLPLLLKLEYDGHPLFSSLSEAWHYVEDDEVKRLPTAVNTKIHTIMSPKHLIPGLESGRLTAKDPELAIALSLDKNQDPDLEARVLEYAQPRGDTGRPCLHPPKKPGRAASTKPKPPKFVEVWPKWYWDATAPQKGAPPGTLDVTTRSHLAPILLRLSWLGHPLFKSREHGWTFRVPANAKFTTRSSPLTFYDPADDTLAEMALRGGYVFYKLPHKDGEKANVGNPLSKPFMKFAQDGTLKSPDKTAAEALDMNAQCSYWISARDRVLSQMVVWQDGKRTLGIADKPSEDKKWGIILPQMITMGTVTRRAIEKTWLTASNAKKNRVGSELKAMVRAPPGYAIVGADVDSEELWISSCMGDAQFGLHGATALGWMTLEGTKASGTDLHSKTANILGISRDDAKVFNYSRIYGAGMRHAILLLLQSNASMLPEQAQKLAENLYASTKGKNTHRTDIFGRKFWFGGTESYVFNKLEEIALSDAPQTPALGCGVTHALSKKYLPPDFGSDYMPSRINWVVQSSGVDYLHLLLVSMDHLIRRYNLQARFLISVHDELRYLVKEADRYRVALALQVANLWTRSMFAVKLGMDDLPQSVAFFSAVDVDHVLRKEVDLPCVTPSQPTPIAPGESLDILRILEKTEGGAFLREESGVGGVQRGEAPSAFAHPDCLVHRAPSAAFLQAQSTSDFEEIKHLSKQASGKAVTGGIGGGRAERKRRRPIGAGGSIDPDQEIVRCQDLDCS
ncbi:DNA-directed DNA polymerase gamma mip1 [Pleurotus pulmonarius]|nr:DNA-directed DNA polymerase gamma mip1 [Pleurotus pulmonarius]